jgi:tRNA (guanine-N7-)-methyltransferase
MKRKLERFAEMAGFSNVVQPEFNKVFTKDHSLKGKWRSDFFKNQKPVVAEFGCGKGEYTVGLARKFTEKNFLGVDIKGARIWRGAKTALEENIENAGFLRTRIELTPSFFSAGEIDEIWITFPDPQPKKKNKRLTSAFFLNKYLGFISSGGYVHLKTDNRELYLYTLSVVQRNNLFIEASCEDLYNSPFAAETFYIKTYYETKFLNEGFKIYYLRFRLQSETILIEPDDEEQRKFF